ncbi:MAG: hypothetical protein HGB18_02265 [Candidatus Moranbacteria bacterium]|nr:hypothetical protein [Candidatus Moranbacteria bacterium]
MTASPRGLSFAAAGIVMTALIIGGWYVVFRDTDTVKTGSVGKERVSETTSQTTPSAAVSSGSEPQEKELPAKSTGVLVGASAIRDESDDSAARKTQEDDEADTDDGISVDVETEEE